MRDKLRFEALGDASLYGDQPELEVRVSFDKAARTLTITDTGIGMSEQEAIDNLGTIARAAPRPSWKSSAATRRPIHQLIGQFGVGFYSGFIVADKITVETRRAGAPASAGVRWIQRRHGRLRDRADRTRPARHQHHPAPA